MMAHIFGLVQVNELSSCGMMSVAFSNNLI